MKILCVIGVSLLVCCCGQYNSERLALYIMDSLAEKSAKKLAPIGATRIFEVSAQVETDKGVENKIEIVKAKVVRYGTDGSGYYEGYSLKYLSGGFLHFVNSSGDRLTLNNRSPAGLFAGGYHIGGKIKYANGRAMVILSDYDRSKNPGTISAGALWGPRAVKDYGFRIIKYDVIDKGVK